MQEPSTPTLIPSPVAGPEPTSDGARPPVAPKRRLKKLRLAIVVLGLGLLALVSTVFGMLMAVSSDLPALENRQEYRAAKNSVLEAADGGHTEIARLTGQQQPHPPHRLADLAQHQERGDRDRGPPLLPAQRRGLQGHRAGAAPGHPQPARGPGRLDHHPAVREERAVGAGQPLGVPEAARGGARLPPRAQVVEAEDPHRVPQHRLLRERRLRRGVGRAHVLRPRPGAGRRHRHRSECRPQGSTPGQGRDPGPGGDARRRDRLAVGLRPRPAPPARPRAPRRGAQAHARGEDGHSAGVPRGRDNQPRPRARRCTRRGRTRASPTSRAG